MRTQPLLACVGALVLSAAVFPQEQAKGQKARQDAGSKSAEEKRPRKRVVTDLSGFELIDSASVKKQPMVVGGTRGVGSPVALAPRLGKLYAAQPAFCWRSAYKAPRFRFALFDDAAAPLFQAEVAGTRYRYPEDAPALEPGRTYSWTVEAAGVALGSGPSAPVAFTVERAAERDLAKLAGGDGYASALARARLFTQHRLWYDAVEAYSELIARYPDRPEPYEERGTIYAQLDVTQALADQDLAQADELRSGKQPRR